MPEDTALILKEIMEAKFFLSTDGTDNPHRLRILDRDGERGLLAFRSEEQARTFLANYGREYPAKAVVAFPNVVGWFRALQAVQNHAEVLTVVRGSTPEKLSVTHIDISPLIRDVGEILHGRALKDGSHRYRGLSSDGG